MAQFQNFFAAKLANDIGAADTAINLDTAPSATSGRMVLEARNPTQREVIKYTGVVGNQLTGVTRGQGGTTAKTHTQNSLVEMNMTAEDLSDLYTAFNTFTNSLTNWFPVVAPVGTVTPLGQKSYQVVLNGYDATGLIGKGTRIRTTRTVAAPIQCASLNGTTQYFNKTSPSGMTFTDDFSVSAWVKLTSYGALSAIVSRYNGTSGWSFQIADTGVVTLVGFNASSANNCSISSYQSIPLNRWVHVAAQLDMSGYSTVSATTSYVMIDGVDVPASMTRAGTNPTALVQAGNLEVGTRNAGSFFPGKIAQVAIYSAKVTQATHLAAMNQGLTGTETNLISAYNLSNSLNDLSANANNLTAQGSATTTNADSPFGNSGVSTTIDYGIVMDISFSTNTTLTIQVPEGCTIPSSGGVTTVDYSTQSVPYGFPRGAGKWTISSLYRHSLSQNTPTVNVWYNLGSAQLKVPSGSWKLRYSASGFTGNGSNPPSMHSTLHTANNAEDIYMTVRAAYISIVGNIMGNFYREGFYNPTASTPTPYYLNAKTDQTSTTFITFGPSAEATIIEAENAYL